MTSHRSPNRRMFFAGVAGAAASLAMPSPGCAGSGGPPPFATARHQFTEVRGARPVPPAQIPRLGGGVLDLTSFRGKVVLVNFWATWCPACRTELPILDQLAGNRRADLAVIAIATDRDRSVVAPFVKQLKLRHLAIGFDPGGLVARAGASDAVDTPFALYGMPISFLLGLQGQVEGYITGEADWLSIEARRLFDYYAGASAKG
ncbi:TlpA family protein disulfide reductase [Bradyrhizobium sp. WSM 1738]|uniref:TlpA family protein disulfide reductase n=1 Tax=Bradyrhizobium hereditatis TaxID=2821405 RepID=UPI001CE32DBD|nr:TlpA disulfide reductase family protein [Bradyrhizobium hereditatis]MCA6116115.1 TlpA family protein disulfide reductase [Bradyrhizobium hereditatis]